MMNEKGPLMFINTASTKIEKSGEQVVYDSRSPKTKKVIEEIATKEFVDEKKLNNIIEMYNRKRPVFCNIEVGEEIIEGVPYMKDGEKLSILITETRTKEIDLSQISRISIVRF